MLRNDAALELLGFILAITGIIAAFVILPAPWYISAPVAMLAGYTILETVLPEVWDTPYDPDYDE
jgi:hypothetical protein